MFNCAQDDDVYQLIEMFKMKINMVNVDQSVTWIDDVPFRAVITQICFSHSLSLSLSQC